MVVALFSRTKFITPPSGERSQGDSTGHGRSLKATDYILSSDTSHRMPIHLSNGGSETTSVRPRHPGPAEQAVTSRRSFLDQQLISDRGRGPSNHAHRQLDHAPRPPVHSESREMATTRSAHG